MYVHVYSGLTSRCKALTDAYHPMKTGRGYRLNIIWPISSDCNIRFYDVFAKDIFKDISYKVIEIYEAEPPEFLKNSGGVKRAIQSGKVVKLARVVFFKVIQTLL